MTTVGCRSCCLWLLLLVAARWRLPHRSMAQRWAALRPSLCFTVMLLLLLLCLRQRLLLRAATPQLACLLVMH